MTHHSEETDWPNPAEIVGEKAVDLSLVYRGPLPASQPNDCKSDAKQKIRLVFSHQLERLWQAERVLLETLGEQAFAPATLENRRIKLEASSAGDTWAHARVEAFGYRLLPLVTCFGGLVCHLTIKFLRRDEPGAIFHGGDLDNRLKTLLDSLRMPQSENEVPGSMRGHGEYLYCLMEDDSLVSKVSIETQRLLTPPANNEPVDYAELVIDVAIKVPTASQTNKGRLL